MIELGKQYTAKMLRTNPDGFVVEISDEEIEVQVKSSFEFPFEKDKLVTVFIYHQEKEMFLGTLRSPQILLDEVDFLQIISITNVGMFLDWGLEKDLFCPYALIVGTVKEGMFVPIRLIKDNVTQRLMGNMKWKSGTQPADGEFYRSLEVEIQVMEPVSLGYSVLVNQHYQGLIYENQIFKPLRTGQKMTAYINKVREDGRIDLLLQRPGYGEVLDAEDLVMEAITEAGGKLKLGDKSPAEDIYDQLKMSKKVFKKAIGSLLKLRRIEMNETAVWLPINDEE